MHWSKYNIIFESNYGIYLYNTYTNNLIKLGPDLLSHIKDLKTGNFSCLSEEDLAFLMKNMIIVDDDINIYRTIKLERYTSRLNSKYLSLTIAPTTACNFKCIYCYESGIKSQSLKNQEKLINSTIDFIKKFKNTEYLRVTWYGGEPLLQFDYIEKLSHKLMVLFDNYKSHMITNAYLLDKSKSEKLKELKITALQVTIDGLEDVHNMRRPHKTNKDSFQRIIENLDYLFSVYPEIAIGFRVNIDKTNQSEYSKIHNFLTKRYGQYKINVHPGYVTDEFSKESNNCCFNTEEADIFVFDQYDNNNIPIFLYPRSSFGECSARHITSFVIGPKGELYKCWNDIGLKEKEVGTLHDFNLSNNLILKYLMENDPLSSIDCENCVCFPICEGGCPYKRIYSPTKQEAVCNAKRNNLISKLKRYVDYKYQNQKL